MNFLKFPWFKKRGFFFFPASFAGWIITLSLAAYAVYSFYETDRLSHSVSDTLINWFFKCALILAAYFAVSLLTQRKDY